MDPNLLNTFLRRLLTRLEEPSSELKHLAAVARQKDPFLKLNQWSTTLQIFMEGINRMANKRLLPEVEVKMWLDQVKELADDVEEILDEISKQASRLKMMAQSQTTMGKKSSLKGLIPACFTISNTSAVVWFDDSLISRIIDITNRLEKLDTERYALGLCMNINKCRPLAASLASITKTTYGRDEDKNKILEMVLRDEVSDRANFSVIPIIGTTGVGETTLTRLVYDDEAVEDFKPRAWVSLYEDSNVFRICKAILESITSKSCNLDLDEVLVQLKEAIFGRKFLFVLDDVSMENYGLWETLKSSFMAGAPGSKIIVTTHKVDIEFPVNLNIRPYRLEVLSDETCWSVFKRHAIMSYPGSGLMREKVFDMCKGLPLAASILGGLVSFKRDDEWIYILNTKIWDFADDKEILPVLKFSYQHLPLLLQRCYLYCAIFPNDYEFKEKELVLLWIAEGLIGGAQEDEQMEDIGSKVFQQLLERSLFQHSSSHASKFRMDDLVKSTARWISGETDFRLDDVLAVNEQPRRFRRAGHSGTSASCDGKHKFELYYDVEHLTTFLPGLIRSDDTHYVTDLLLSDLLPKFKRLRALSLEKQNITELPSSVDGLRYLRYVNLSNTLIRRLPDSICSLLILQILLLRDCSLLVELPPNLKNLINLRHLDFTGINLIKEMPLGMKELECLVEASDILLKHLYAT